LEDIGKGLVTVPRESPMIPSMKFTFPKITGTGSFRLQKQSCQINEDKVDDIYSNL